MHPSFLREMRPETAVELIRLARETGADRWIERFGGESFERLIISNIGRIPLEYLQEIKWYAEIIHDDLLMRKILTFVDNR